MKRCDLVKCRTSIVSRCCVLVSVNVENRRNETFPTVHVNASFQHRMRFEEAAEAKPFRNDSAVPFHQTSSKMCLRFGVNN